MLGRSLPYLSRAHAWVELKAWTLQAVPTGVLAGGVVGVLVNTVFAGRAQEWVLALAVALVTGAGPFGYVTSIAWSHWSQGRDKVESLIRLKGLFAACLVLAALVPVNGVGLILLVLAVLGTGILWCGIITIRAIVWRTNYSRSARTAFAARSQVLVSIVMSVVGAGAEQPLLHRGIGDGARGRHPRVGAAAVAVGGMPGYRLRRRPAHLVAGA